ncbi:MAG TPA: hypothetical protein VN611_11405 [Patescibacteria group bacterium]|nr:hypothetical protein [Patescibacteria group bacterium]
MKRDQLAGVSKGGRETFSSGLAAFFFLTSIAATTAVLSLVEVPVAYCMEEFGWSRKKTALFNAMLICGVGVLASLSADKTSLLGEMAFGGRDFFDWFDYLSSNVLLPAGGLLIALFVGYRVDRAIWRRNCPSRELCRMDG